MSDAIAVLDSTPRVAETLDAVYRLDLDTMEWLGLLRAALGCDSAGWVRMDPRGGEVIALHAEEPTERLLRSFSVQGTSGGLVPPLSFPGTLGATQSELTGFPFPEPFKSAYTRAGVQDCFLVSGGPSSCGFGVAVTRMLARRSRLTARARRYWNALAIHLATSARLRSASTSSFEAVLAPDGRLLHATGPAADRAHREALRRAAQAIDRARVNKDDPVAAIESWSALVDGRWSLVDEFERDGRHFLVARVNEPSVSGSPTLSRRERQVASLAALGRCNKQIADELGIELASVSSYLQRARQKLGVRSRAELISRF